MTPAERVVYDSLVSKGYTVLTKGWPDMLAYKDGEVIAVEVKHGADTVKPHQAECHRVLRQAGLKVESMYVPETVMSHYKAQKRMRKLYHPTDQETSEAVNTALESIFSEHASQDVTKSDTIL